MMESSLEAHVQQSKAVQAFGETVHNGLVQLGTSVTKHLEKANGLPTRQTSPRELRSAEASSSEADGDCSASAPAGIHGPGPD